MVNSKRGKSVETDKTSLIAILTSYVYDSFATHVLTKSEDQHN